MPTKEEWETLHYLTCDLCPNRGEMWRYQKEDRNNDKREILCYECYEKALKKKFNKITYNTLWKKRKTLVLYEEEKLKNILPERNPIIVIYDIEDKYLECDYCSYPQNYAKYFIVRLLDRHGMKSYNYFCLHCYESSILRMILYENEKIESKIKFDEYIKDAKDRVRSAKEYLAKMKSDWNKETGNLRSGTKGFDTDTLEDVDTELYPKDKSVYLRD